MTLTAAALRPDESHKFPVLYIVNRLAQAWGIPPWELESDDPAVATWIRRALTFGELEADAQGVAARAADARRRWNR